jgi:uncharacterized Zn-binding protein involved in type VI secretion
MGQPAANAGSMVTATDIHIVLVPSPGGPIPTPLPHSFVGRMGSGLVQSVKVGGQPAANLGTIAANQPPHLPTPPGTSFVKPPANQARMLLGSTSVMVGGQPAVRNADAAITCDDPADLPVGRVVAPSPTVSFG